MRFEADHEEWHRWRYAQGMVEAGRLGDLSTRWCEELVTGFEGRLPVVERLGCVTVNGIRFRDEGGEIRVLVAGVDGSPLLLWVGTEPESIVSAWVRSPVPVPPAMAAFVCSPRAGEPEGYALRRRPGDDEAPGADPAANPGG